MPYLKKHFQTGDSVLFEDGCYAEILRSKNAYSWNRRKEISLEEAVKKIKLINPSFFDKGEIVNWSDIFSKREFSPLQADFNKNNFLKLNLLLPIAGALVINISQAGLSPFISRDINYTVTSLGIPVLLLLLRAEMGSKRLNEKAAANSFKAKFYLTVHQILFALGLVTLMLFECFSSFIFQESHLTALAIGTFALYIVLMYLSDLCYEKHIPQLRV